MARYVKAVFDFPSTEVGDLSFHVDDIIQVIYDVDDNWFCGKLNGSVGNFPKNFVTPLHLPEIGQGQNLFVAVKDFYSDVPGDLPFRRGKINHVLITRNWWCLIYAHAHTHTHTHKHTCRLTRADDNPSIFH